MYNKIILTNLLYDFIIQDIPVTCMTYNKCKMDIFYIYLYKKFIIVELFFLLVVGTL